MSVKFAFKEDQEAHERCIAHKEAYALSLKFQDDMQKLGIAWHNNFAHECTADFGCCTDIGNYKVRIRSMQITQQDIRQDIDAKPKYEREKEH